MPVFRDHPIRLLLLRHNKSQAWLSREAGVSAASVDKLLQGLTRRPNDRILACVAGFSGLSSDAVADLVEEWWSAPVTPLLDVRARSVLLLGPEDLSVFYSSFRDWRLEFADSLNEFASMLRVSRDSVRLFEEGRRVRGGVPPAVHRAIVRAFGVSDDYVLALGRL